ncbi:uncharacterized protein LOC142584283 isoform X2 [Dermacentor variabilis]|uniref:uncharacterized protein LOC142584283 isoform X2 n=1 Tax=Dermacentor variabilis TaxID=34621 RepID=UPI003F5BBB65
MEMLVRTVIYVLFACTFADSYDEQLSTGNATLEQLYQALNTSDPVWLLKRTDNIDNSTCIYTKTMFLNKTDYEFKYYFMASGRMYNYTFYAKLTEEGPKIILYDETGQMNDTIEYVLLHWDSDIHCGILYFKDFPQGIPGISIH